MTLDDILANFNNTDDYRRCAILVKTPHINYKWHIVNCSTEFTYIGVVCEKKIQTWKRDNITLRRNNTFCPTYYIYNAASCFKISTRKFALSSIQDVFPNTLFYVLNKWSYGNVSRENMYVYINNNAKHRCLETRDFHHQELKNWRITNCTDSQYYLEKRDINYFVYNCMPGRYFECSDGECILNIYICDGKFDCYDKSDELMCQFISESFHLNICSYFLFRCADDECISISKLCDDKADCDNQSDEVRCPIKTGASTSIHKVENEHIERSSCPDGWSLCNTEKPTLCYPTHLQCVFEMSRIFYCPHFEHLRHCETHTCPTMFKCPDMYCLPTYLVCDGYRHCQSGEDERNCDTLKCVGLLKCKGEIKCVHPENICDGVVHCEKHRDDEILCNLKSVPNKCIYRGYAIKCIVLPCMIDIISDLKAITISEADVPSTFTFKNHYNLIIIVINVCKFQNKILTKSLLKNMVNLVTLDLKSNGIINIEQNAFIYLRKLIILNLQDNSIAVVFDNLFTGTMSLPILDLSRQLILNIEGCFCCSYNNIAILNISHNKIYALKESTFHNLKLITLDLRFNNIQSIAKYTLHGIIHNMYFDNSIMCCYTNNFKSCVSAQCSDMNEVTCINILSNKWIQVGVIIVLFLLMILNGICIWLLNRAPLNPTHAHLIKHQLLSTIVYIMSLLFIISSLIFHKDSYIYVNSIWPSSSMCTMLGSISLVSMLISKLSSFLIVLNQLIAIRFALVYRPFTAYVMSLWVFTGWVIYSCIVYYLSRTTTYVNNKFCVNFLSMKYDLVPHLITFAFAAILFIHDILMMCFFLVIIYHVINVGKMLDTLQHIESRLVSLKRHAIYYCSHQIFITFGCISIFIINSISRSDNLRVILFCLFAIMHSMCHILQNNLRKHFLK